MMIDGEIYKLMAEYGFKRVEGLSDMTTVIARLVQLSINKAFARIVSEEEKSCPR